MTDERRLQGLGQRGLSRRAALTGAAALMGGAIVPGLASAQSGTPGATTPGADPTTIISTKVNAYMKSTKTPGVAVVYHVGGVDGFLPFGWANLEHQQPITQDTVFEIGSVTKSFTATLLATQIKDIDPTYPFPKQLSDPVTKYLPPEIAGTALQHVTLLQLATQTSGFPRTGGGQAANNLFADLPPSQQLINFWRQWQPSAATPTGTHWLYSNVGFVTLGYAVGGQPIPPQHYLYNDLLAQRVTGPLGMTATGAKPPAGAVLAQGYVVRDGQISPAKSQAADIKSTPRDSLIWLKAQLGLHNAKIPSALARAITLTHTIAFSGKSNQSPLAFDMGLAWQIYDRRAGVPPILNKDGATGRGGFTCLFGFIPSRQIAVATLTNLDAENGDTTEGTGNGNVDTLTMDILRTLAAATPGTPEAQG